MLDLNDFLSIFARGLAAGHIDAKANAAVKCATELLDLQARHDKERVALFRSWASSPNQDIRAIGLQLMQNVNDQAPTESGVSHL